MGGSIMTQRSSMNRKIWIIIVIIIIPLFFGKIWATALGKGTKIKGKSQWKYIIIHHSATKRGNAKLFGKYHKGRGMKNGLAYHFVIDNGTCGKRDGQLEIGNRWEKQLPGGGCQQDWYNQVGIHICLVGDFTRKPPSRKQIRTLINLVDELRKRYNIPYKNIIGHKQVPGAKTKCPGRKFPWRDFYSALKKL